MTLKMELTEALLKALGMWYVALFNKPEADIVEYWLTSVLHVLESSQDFYQLLIFGKCFFQDRILREFSAFEKSQRKTFSENNVWIFFL